MKTLIYNINIVNEFDNTQGAVLINGEKIDDIIYGQINPDNFDVDKRIDGEGKTLIPGVIDDQVHFREPGLTHKGEIATESKAAIAGGITSLMEMPNTNPQTTTIEALEDKYKLGSQKSLTNYSFYMGATNDNIKELRKVDINNVCGIKVFMGSSTGNMLVDNREALDEIFKLKNILIATHCEDEQTIKNNTILYKEKFKGEIPFKYHPEIRSAEACYKSSSFAIEIAKQFDTRLHILHLSTEKELSLFSNKLARTEKNITAEVCVHHLWFDANQYDEKGAYIKWNPAVKYESDKKALFEALLNDTIDVIATDHAPHTYEEKQNTYLKAPSGGPLVQHSLAAMLEFSARGQISIEKVVDKMCHAPADLYKIKHRGYIRKGYFADFALVDLNSPWTVSKENILYKCGWSPFDGTQFTTKVTHTFVNGNLVYENGNFDESIKGQQLTFAR